MIDVCMVSYNAPVHMKTFLESYEKVQRRESRLLVRVNEPSAVDKKYLEDYVRTARTGTRKAVVMGDNIGYARSMNQLASMGDNEIIGLFNMDVRLTDDLWDCVAYMRENEDIGVLGPRLWKHPQRPRLMCGGGVVGSQRHPEFRGWNVRDSDEFHEPLDVVNVSGAAYFVRRSVWDELTRCQEYATFLESVGKRADGALLPTEHGYEETFCSYHARHHGHRVVYYGPAMMYHKQGGSGKVKSKMLSRSKTLFQEACANVHGMECES